MEIKNIRSRRKRIRAGLLAFVCFFVAVLPFFDVTTIDSRAAGFSGKNIWRGGAEQLFGHSRNYLYRWTDGHQMTFCISPGKRMGAGVVSSVIPTTVEDADIPYIRSTGDYELLADICSWYDRHGSIRADNATYAAVQAAVWAVMNGGWESAGALEEIVNRHVPGTIERWKSLRAFIDRTDAQAGMPAWLETSGRRAEKKAQALEQTDGAWKLELDISSVPQLAACEWQFGDNAEGWSRQVSDGKLIFTYTGSQVPKTLVSTPVPDSLSEWAHNTETMNIYVPKTDAARTQAMISAGVSAPKFYICLSGEGVIPEKPGEEPQVVIYEHHETFTAHYQVGLEKLCAETGQPLAGARFRVLEALDAGGIGEGLDVDGIGEGLDTGRTGEGFDVGRTGKGLDASSMTPGPAVWENYRVCGEEATDAEGHFIHKDVKNYEYAKTYCGGHPKPESFTAEEMFPDLNPEDEGYEEKLEAVQEQEASAEQQWQALVDQCAEYNKGNHFHDETPGAAKEAMLADRDAVYKEFIGLGYRYAFQETQARYGYIRHGQHGDDQPVPVFRVESLEAGGEVSAVEGEYSDRVVVNENVGDTGLTGGEAETVGTRYGSGGAQAVDRTGGAEVQDEERFQGGDGACESPVTELLSGTEILLPVSSMATPLETADSAGESVATPSGTVVSARENAATPSETAVSAGKGKIAATPSEAVLTAAGTASASNCRAQLRYQFAGSRKLRSLEEPSADVPMGEPELPEPIEDDVEGVIPLPYDTTPKYSVTVKNHRTEGELHINKRDLDLAAGEHSGYDSYGDTQGDATLEGAVYGLYAAEDIVHPDGKTGVVYRAGELTAVAATDKNGDASFMAYTEEGDTPHSWVGRPLIAGRYLVREIARSEGYELTVDPAAEEFQIQGYAAVTSAMSHPIDMHDGSWLEFDVTCENTSEGFDILVSGFPEGSAFYRSRMTETSEEEEIVTGVEMVPTGEFERAKAGEYRLDETGSYIPQRDEHGEILYDTGNPVMRTYFVTQRLSYYPGGEYRITVDPAKWADAGAADNAYICEETNAILKQLGYTVPAQDRMEKAPWTVLPLKGRTNQELVKELLGWFETHSFWSSARIAQIWEEGGSRKAMLLHDYPRGSAVYEAATGTLYVRVQVRTETGERHMYVPFPAGSFTLKNGYATVVSLKQKEGEIPLGAAMEEYLETEYPPLYERYKEGDLRLDGRGKPIPVYREEYIRETAAITTSDYVLTPLAAVYDAISKSYRIHVENTVDWSSGEGPVTMTFRAVAPYTTCDDPENEMFYSDYLTDIAGAGASAFACIRGDEPEGLAELVYPGQISPVQDGAGSPGFGSRLKPVDMRENIIAQRVKVIKTVQEKSGPADTAPGVVSGDVSGQEQVPNFRFKAYLKSNLERIYRDEEGKIVWLDRRGREIDIAGVKQAYPALVPAVFTKVPRKTEVLYKQTQEAVTANEVLYPEGEDEPQKGYTAVLETVEKQFADGDGARTVRVFNYDKFFDALTVANYDLWDDAAEKSTSFRPLGNAVNRSGAAEKNAETSDMVRQFAIDWYLDGEAARMDPDEKTAYGDQFYDEALRRAIRKAEDYLKPFFAYDLDEIYAVSWDGAADGGPDGDPSTVNADEAAEGCYYGISAGLPYGTYVVAEVQPHYEKLKDFKNRHYRIDSPKEVVVPSVYMQTEAEDPEDTMSAEYLYDSGMSMEDMQDRYAIRFGEEVYEAADGSAKAYVTEAHNQCGDFEIYRYGLDIGLLTNGVKTAKEGEYFALTQDVWKPYLNYYNDADNRAETVTYYLAEGKPGYEAVGQVYRYSSVTEDAAEADGVRFSGGPATEENPEGYYFLDHVRAMRGVKTAYEGLYSPMLVPRSLADAADDETTPGADGAGDGSYARVRFVNTPYAAKLRIEKLDSETGENLLHDDAVFNIYAAERDESPDGEGRVLFYDADTTIYGSREFLESMRASDIRPWRGVLYQGVVSEGTPVCDEKTRVFQTDERGARVGQFRSYTTTVDGMLEGAGEDFDGGYGQQNAGWLETPEPLAAGVYVLAEVKAPAGYVRSRPVAIEVYSDTVTYYQRGSADNRVAATVYDSHAEGREDAESAARIYVENAPSGLLVEKRKETGAEAGGSQTQTVTYKLSGRVDGSLAEIGGSAEYEYAFKDGVYMGYAWRKGTLEYLMALKVSGMDVRIVYHGGLFAGYGYVTQALETADDANGYVTGALMTLYEGLELTPSGDGEDLAYEGLLVERGASGNVERMYIGKGYAGSRTEFVNTGSDSNGTMQDVWKADRVERGDTDILFYDLGGLELFRTENVAGQKVLYAYDRDHNRLEVNQLEEDKELSPATDGSQSIFAFRSGTAVFELAGGDFQKISYSAADKVFEGDFARPEKQAGGSVRMSEGVTLYHLDADGNRDGLVDPYTGMAYVLADENDGSGDGSNAAAGIGGGADKADVRVLVWPVHITRDSDGHLLAQEKITASRIATLGETAETEYLTGTWESDDGGQSHRMTTLTQNRSGQNLNGEPVLTDNNGDFDKSMEPVYDEHGLVRHYRYSGESYETDTPLYDRNGRPVREKGSDLTGAYDKASYVMKNDRAGGDAAGGNRSAGRGTGESASGSAEVIFHRAGESYILENTWVTGESTPDDPFSGHMTEGQADLLRRVPAGTYIMEELAAPEGYLKGLPTGVVIRETAEVQKTEMTDRTTKLLISKADGTADYTYEVLDMLQTDASGNPTVLGTVTEGKGSFGQTQVSGARLALFEASRVYTSDLDRYPAGSYLQKTGNQPFAFHSTNSRVGAEEILTASWLTGTEPVYLEGVPAGEYLLEEMETPPGMVSAPAMEVTVHETGRVQIYALYNDHTKVEIEKYTGDGSARKLVNGAEFTLYEAVTDAGGQVMYDANGWPVYDPQKEVDHFTSDDGERYAGFIREFEAQFGHYGTKLRTVSWEYNGQNHTAHYVNHIQIDASADGGEASTFPTSLQMTLQTEDGAEIRVTAYGQGESRLGRNWVYEYRLDCHALSGVNERASSYLTEDGMRRWDYLPAGAAYVAVETKPPVGFAAAEPLLLQVRDIADVQRYRIRNEEGAIIISKTFRDGEAELPGARLALYRAAADGGLIQEQEYLAAEWTSGQDGVYTEADRLNGRIPQGYREGDRRPHTLKRLPEGNYWLTELKSPDYYTTFQPVKIEYHTDDPIRIVRVSDDPAEGRVTVTKTDPEGGSLTGAVFEVAAYRQPDLTDPIFTRCFSDSGGTAALSGLPVGEVQEDGTIIPYCYRLKEILPPEGYAVNPQIYSFEFAPDRDGVSFGWGESAEYVQRIIDRKTRIAVKKKDFGERYVPGAELAVYRITGTGENGGYLCDMETPVERWITSETESEHVLEGLIAGRSYLLAEISVPDGYQVMPPVAFTISTDGRRISSVSSQPGVIQFHDLYSVTIRGRYAVKSEVAVTDRNGMPVVSWTASGDGHVLTEADGILDGEIYTLTERTFYSDGAAEVTGRQTRRLYLTDGGCLIEDRRPDGVRLSLCETEGEAAAGSMPGSMWGKEAAYDGMPENASGEEAILGGLPENPPQEEPTFGNELISYEPTEEQPEFTEGDPASEREIFSNRKTYVLAETTFYGDGSRIESGRMAFGIGDDGFVAMITGYDGRRRVTVSKQDITGGKELPGAVLQLLDEAGEIIEEWVSEEQPHPVDAVLIPGETYKLREILPPEGYAYASEISFTVSEYGSTEQVVMEDKPTCVSVTKTDITGEKELPGAKLQIREYIEASEGQQETQPQGELAEEWISTGEAHEIVGKLKAGKTYVLHEEAAPAGYAYAADIVFTVSLDGRIDKVVMKDEALPVRPHKSEQPEKPEKPVRIPGTVEAEYQAWLIGDDAVPLGSLAYYMVPETGDGNMKAIMAALFLMICSAAVCRILWKRMEEDGGRVSVKHPQKRPEKNQNGRKRLMFIALVPVSAVVLAAATGITVCAEETVIETSDTEITIRYGIFPDLAAAGQETTLPDTYLWQDKEYSLKSWQLTTHPMPEIAKYARESVRYDGVEQAAAIPETIEAVIQDEDTGRSAPVTLPLERTETSGWRWEDGFAFPLTVWGYDSGSFVLGNEIVEVREDQPFAGHEEALLALIGVDPEYYRIDSVEWSGPPQIGEDGLIYRQAAASGQKYVADIEAVYGGRAIIPEQPGMAYEAVYELEMPETEAESEPGTTAESSENYVEVTASPVPGGGWEGALDSGAGGGGGEPAAAGKGGFFSVGPKPAACDYGSHRAWDHTYSADTSLGRPARSEREERKQAKSLIAYFLFFCYDVNILKKQKKGRVWA